MGQIIDESLIRELARRIVERAAPEELAMFGPVSRRYFADPGWFSGSDCGDGLLAFDTAQFTALVTPVALVAATQVTQHLVTRLLEQGVPGATRAVRRLLGLPDAVSADAPDGDVSLNDDEWAWVRRAVREVAERGGVQPGLAQTIADAVVGQGRDGGGSR